MAEIAKQLERARRSLEKNKLRDAAEEYQAIFDEAPGNQEAILALGDLYVRLNEPVRAAHYYGLQFDRLLDSSDTAKAAAIYGRFLRGVPQPAERLIRYAVQLQKQNRVAEAVEQYNAAAERYHEMNQETEALGCYEKISQLDSDNPNRHLAVAELAEKLGQKELSSHSYLRAGQLCQSLGEIDLALEYFRHAHELGPNDRTVALFFAEARLRHGNPAGAVELLDPFADGESDTTFLALFGEGLLRTGQLDRARDAFVAFYRQKQDGFTKMFELAGAYIRTGEDDKGADVLQVTKEWMKSVRRENEFAAQVDRMTTVYPNSLELAKLVAQLYEELNRETKYFDSLVHLFDLYFDGGNIKAACDVLDRLVDIDPYDYRNHQRIAKLQGKADPAFLKNILARAAKAASVITRPEGFNAGGTRGDRPAPQQEEHKAQQALDDLIVQVEIFFQYSLHAKAIERLERIAEIFPGEEDKNERLHNLFDRANWWPKGKTKPAPKAVLRRDCGSRSPSRITRRSGSRNSRLRRGHSARPFPNFRIHAPDVPPGHAARSSHRSRARNRQVFKCLPLHRRNRWRQRRRTTNRGIHRPRNCPRRKHSNRVNRLYARKLTTRHARRNRVKRPRLSSSARTKTRDHARRAPR